MNGNEWKLNFDNGRNGWGGEGECISVASVDKPSVFLAKRGVSLVHVWLVLSPFWEGEGFFVQTGFFFGTCRKNFWYKTVGFLAQAGVLIGFCFGFHEGFM